jgi:AP endonuclease-2
MTWFSFPDGTAFSVSPSTRKVSHGNSLPRYILLIILGYSGVVIYTRNTTCAPIRAEEGITGFLSPPNSTTAFRDLPDDQQIGGYPSLEQLSEAPVDAVGLDCEGRCVILEFPAFVLLGVYSPAARDETRDDFRQGFVSLLDARIRNIVSMGKRVILTGDLNVSVGAIDSAHLIEAMRKGSGSEDEFVSSPVRRIYNQLFEGARVIGERDEGREAPVLHDICRSFHPDRRGMYTCWETRVNARPGNYGARIDYVLSSLDMKEWWSDSNIQEGLMVRCVACGIDLDNLLT